MDYSGFRHASGGQWASRLRLWRVPECALTTPAAVACQPVALRTSNDLAAGVASAEVAVEQAGQSAVSRQSGQLQGDVPLAVGRGSMVLLAAGGSGSDGDFTATSLAPSSTWSAGGSSGDFSWQYPLRMPPATGPTPSIALAYASASVDGRSEVTNNQPSWIGEGFEYNSGYIERRYVPCMEDMKNNANNTDKTGDMCWRSDNATMSFNGRGGELIKSGSTWHATSEDGSKIEKLTGASNGDAGSAATADIGEYWKVTTNDGTQYFFGLHSLPGQSSNTNSVSTVPVYGNHTGEPCRAATFAASSCVQAWRWNLDYVIDVHGNTMSNWYGKETNKYGRNNSQTDLVQYDRASYLTRIDYGTYDRTLSEHGVTERSVVPYAKVEFETGMRCFTNCGTDQAPVKENWKDTPWDQNCASSPCNQTAPTFWTGKRLKKVTTSVWDTTVTPSQWQPVESWTLSHTFTATADSTHTGLWLDRIDHAGLVGTVVNMPPVTFGAVSLANRVLTEHGATDNWLRVNDIITETGAKIKVDYSAPECTATMVAGLTPHTNTKRCYPVLVPDPNDPSGETLVKEWWHKYRVEHVTENDVQLVDGHQADPKHTWYEYTEPPAWHYANDDGLSKPDRKTWSQWRGYAQVATRSGSNAATQTLTVTNYLRGMHKDRLNTSGGEKSVIVGASLGSETVYDEDQFAGQIREQVVYNGTVDKPVSKTVNVPWRSNALASRTINGDVAEARYVKTKTTYSATALGVDGARGWRVSRGDQDFHQTYGTVNWSQNDGDLAMSNDEKCTTTTYNRNLAKNITTTMQQVFVTALPCGTPPQSIDDVISDSRSYYDGATSVTDVPKYGDVTKSEQLKDWTSAGGTQWETVSQATYDGSGRTKTSTDLKGSVTTTTYTPAAGGPTTNVATKITAAGATPYNWSSNKDLSPFWGVATKEVDANGQVTVQAVYDGMGRVAKVWNTGWSYAGHETQPSSEFTYNFAVNRDGYPYITSKTLNPVGSYITSHQIYDAFLRPRQTQSPSANNDGSRIVTDTVYDEFGREAASYAAHAEPGAPSGVLWWEPEWSLPTVTKMEFDRASRGTATVLLSGDGLVNLVEKWRTVTLYEGDLTQTVPPGGGTPTTVITDIDGRAIKLRQHKTPAGLGGGYDEYRYEYDRKDKLVRSIDPSGNEWTSKYDAKGRQYESVDPDKGKSKTQYNAFDQVEKTTDGRGEVLWFVYDGLGRKTQVRDDSATGALRTEFKYDSLYSGQGGFRGQLTQSIRYEPPGSANAYKWQVRNFDGRYQPSGVNYVVPAVEAGLDGTYVYAYEYSQYTGAPTKATMPGGGGLVNEELKTVYDSVSGAPARLNTNITGPDATMVTAWYDAFGIPSMTTLKLPGGLYVDNSFEYYDDTRRLKTVKVQPETAAGTVSSRTYDYDPSGNITSIADAPQVGSTDTQCFGYDGLARLTSAWTPKSGVNCSATPSLANLGGPQPYWQDWTIDSTGNRTTEVSHASAGETTRTYTVPAGGANVPRPHAVTQMKTEVSGQSPVYTNYNYDNSGNMLCRPSGSAANNCTTGSGSQQLAWDAEGRLSSVQIGSTTSETNIYGADGTRLIRRDPAGTTLFLPGQEIRREGTVNTGTRYYSFAGQVCASRKGSSANSAVNWLFNDHQGTQQVSVNAATQAVTIRRQNPFGGARPGATNPAWPNGKGFVGGDNDPTGLVNVGARQYDQLLGRFVSVDPVIDLSDPHHWNGYAYAYNSPVTRSDPSGLDPCPGGGGGCYYDGTTTRFDGVTPEQMAKARAESDVLAQKVAEERRKREEAERKRRECQANFWCRTKSRVTDAASATWDWVVDHRGMLATVAATAGCFIPAVGWGLCAAFQAGAFAMRTDQKIRDEGGWEKNKNSIIIDGVITGATMGLGGLVRSAQFGTTAGIKGAYLPGYMEKPASLLGKVPGLRGVAPKLTEFAKRAKDAQLDDWTKQTLGEGKITSLINVPSAIAILGFTVPMTGVKQAIDPVNILEDPLGFLSNIVSV